MLHAKAMYVKVCDSGRNQKWGKKIGDSDMIHKSVMSGLYSTMAIAIERGQPSPLLSIATHVVNMQDTSFWH